MCKHVENVGSKLKRTRIKRNGIKWIVSASVAAAFIYKIKSISSELSKIMH